MRKTLKLRGKLLAGGLVLALAVFCGMFCASTFVSRAESQGRITAASVNIRKEPSTSSEVVGSTERDKTVSIVSQEKGADGYTWYKVYVDANTMGYIRADLLTITDGTTPPAGTSSPSTPPASAPPEPGNDPGNSETPVEMTEVHPVSATVIGDAVKILDAASTGGQELAQVQNGTVLTVAGQGTDSAGTIWYQVTFVSNETPIAGYVQSVYLTLSEDLTPITQDPPQNEDPVEPAPTEAPKQFETLYKDGKWLVYNIDKPEEGYPIQELIDGVQKNAELYEEGQKTIKNQKLIIIILVFLLVAAIAAIAFLVFKVRDMMDSAYFSEVENETLRKRNAGSQSGRVMHSVGTDRQGTRPSGSRQGGAGQEQRQTGSSQEQRQTGGSQRSGAPQNQRPTGTSQRPSGPSGQRSGGAQQGQRQPSASQRPAGTSQVQRPVPSQNQRPVSPAQDQRGSGVSQGQRSGGAPQGARPVQGGGQKNQSQPRNFITDDEEFEFEFLNYDGDDDK